jgi:hypothetical protein
VKEMAQKGFSYCREIFNFQYSRSMAYCQRNFYYQKMQKMKPLKYLLSLGLVVISASALHAQEYKINVQNTKDGKLTLNDFPNDLPVEGYSGTEVIVTSDLPGKAPDRAKGLQPVYAGGTDNTGIAVNVEKNGNQVTLPLFTARYKVGQL